MKKITVSYSKRFHNCMDKLIQLNYMERYLLDWLVEEADEECVVKTMQVDRQRFINFILRISNSLGADKHIHYKDNTVKSGLQVLKKLGFLLAPPEGAGRGWLWVNPEYYFKGNPELRKNMINYINRKLEPQFKKTNEQL